MGPPWRTGSMVGLVVVWGLLGAACTKVQRVSTVPTAEQGRIGVWVDSIPEGAVVHRVAPGSAADHAGLRPGDLVLEANGALVGSRRAEVGLERGPVGSTVVLRVAGAMGKPVRTVTVRRERVDPATRAKVAWRKVGGAPRTAAGRLARLLETHPRAPADVQRVLFGPLKSLFSTPQRKQIPRLVAAIVEAYPEDPSVLSHAGQVLFRVGDRAAGTALLVRARDNSGPGLVLPDGARLDTGASAPWRRALLRAEVAGRHPRDLPDAERHLDEARLVQDLGRGGSVPASLGLAPVPEPTLVRVPVAGARPDSVRLLEGTVSLVGDQPTVLCFWATWCGPCKAELPLLEAWARLHPEVQVLAVSTDEQAPARVIEGEARTLGLRQVQVAHDPQLARELVIEGLPEWRLYGPDGSLLGRQLGFSEELGMAGLDAAMAAAVGPAVAWMGGGLAVSAHLDPAPRVGALLVREDTLWMAEPGRAPRPVGAAPTPTPLGGQPTDLGWAGGPVVGEGNVLRAWTTDGRPRWMRTLPGRVTDLHNTETTLFVATTAGWATVDEAGTVDWRPGPSAEALAEGAGGLVLAAGAAGVMGLHRSASGWQQELHEHTPAHAVAASGAWGDASIRELVSARGWTALQTAQGVVLVVDAAGVVRGRIDSDAALGSLTVFDSDGDGRPELVLSIEGAGVVALAVQVDSLDGTLQERTRR